MFMYKASITVDEISKNVPFSVNTIRVTKLFDLFHMSSSQWVKITKKSHNVEIKITQ